MKRLLVVAVGLVTALSAALSSCTGDESPPSELDAAVDAVVAPPDASVADGAVADAARVNDAGTDVTVPLVDTCGDAGVAPGVWVADPHLCVTVFAGAITLARQMAFAPNGDLFVESAGSITALADLDKDQRIGPGEAFTFVAAEWGLNHGLAFSPDGAFVYASTASTVFRWAYAPGDRAASGSPEIVVRDMPMGGHVSRTLAFDSQGRLYVNVGSQGDVDLDPALLAERAQVRRFTIAGAIPVGGIAWVGGDVFASGLRNEVGIAFDSRGRLWGVENSSDGSYSPGPTADVPAEKLNRLDAPGCRFYGYPHCWTELVLDGGLGPRTQWAYATPQPKTDSWCRDPANVQPPAAAMTAHWAPLGIAEYAGASLPWKGDLFVTSHGSSFLSPAVGRLVARAHLVGDTITSVTPIIGHRVDGGLEEGTWDARPVDIRTGPDGALYVSDDNGSRVFRIGYRP